MFIKDNKLSAMRALGLPGCCVMLLVACSGGGGGGGGGDDPANFPPSASFVATPSSGQPPLVVALDATASRDSDGSISSYSWDFGDGSAAGSGVTTSHTFQQAGDFVVRLTVRDDDGETGSTTRTVTVIDGPPPAEVVISGKVTFDRVPFSSDQGEGLDYAATFAAPARQVVIQVLRPDQSLVAAAATDEGGNYSVAVPSDTDLFVRARAETSKPGPAGWDLRVLDNTAGDALYVLDGSVFNTGIVAQTRNLRAASGWPASGGQSYSGTRAAAPFAILDTMYSALRFVEENAGEPVEFQPLSVFWSKDNRSSLSWDPDTGNIQTSLFWPTGQTDPTGIYVLGDEGADTDEFDQHVLAHEFHHYIEATVSRPDSPGGSHSIAEKLDMRVSFSEGFANAFSAMVLNDPGYRDSFGAAQASDFGFSVEHNDFRNGGWYNEGSVHSLVWDFYDVQNENGDAVSAGYSAMFDVLSSDLRNGQPLGSLFSFVVGLKQRPGIPGASVDQLVAAQGVVAATMDAFASTESDDGGINDVLPVYTDIFLNGETKTVCGNTDEGIYNAIGNRRFLKFNVPSDRTIDIRVESTAAGDPDPDLVLFKDMSRVVSDCEGPDAAAGCTEPKDTERFNALVEAGDYVLEVYDSSHLSDGSAPRICMNVSVTG